MKKGKVVTQAEAKPGETPLTTEKKFFKDNPQLDPAKGYKQASFLHGNDTEPMVDKVKKAFPSLAAEFDQIEADTQKAMVDSGQPKESWVWDMDQATKAASDQLAGNVPRFLREIQRMEQAFAAMGKYFTAKMQDGFTDEIKFDLFTEVLIELQEYAELANENYAPLVGVNDQIGTLTVKVMLLRKALLREMACDQADIRLKLFSILHHTVNTIIELDKDNWHGAV